MYYSLKRIIILVFLILLNCNLNGVNSKSVSCLGYNGGEVNWWFLLSKQISKGDGVSIGAGYFYVDSDGVTADIDNSMKGPITKGTDAKKASKMKTIKELLEQHTDTAYTDNKEVFKECTIDGYKLKKNFRSIKKCNDALNDFFNAQTWYHDTVEIKDNEVAAALKEANKKDGGGFSREDKNNKFLDEMDALDEDRDGESYGEKKTKNGIKNFKAAIGVRKKKYISLVDDNVYGPDDGKSRHAHAKFLVSVDVNNGNGYIMDHSANIPSIVSKSLNGYYNSFEPFELLVKELKKGQGSQGKFAFSHHFFCFNFAQTDFKKLMATIRPIKPRFVQSNYVGRVFNEDDDESLIEDDYNVKEFLSGYNTNNKCSKFYNNLYVSTLNDIPDHGSDLEDMEETRITSGTLVNELLIRTDLKKLQQAQCLHRALLTNKNVRVTSFSSRNRPKGWSALLNKEISRRDDNYKMRGKHLTFNTYGLDPYTVLAKNYGGPFYVSTLPQASRVELPSIKTRSFSIYVLKAWKSANGDGSDDDDDDTTERKRHEKLLFSHEDNAITNIVCVGDANRNLVHTLYAGLIICFRSDKVAIKLREKVHSISTAYMYDASPMSDTNKILKPEAVLGDQYPPGFIQSLIKPNEIVNFLSTDEDSDGDSIESSSSEDDSYNSEEEEELFKGKKKAVPKGKGKAKTPIKNKSKAKPPVKVKSPPKKILHKTKTDAVKRDRSEEDDDDFASPKKKFKGDK